jgi:hypothetical protein
MSLHGPGTGSRTCGPPPLLAARPRPTSADKDDTRLVHQGQRCARLLVIGSHRRRQSCHCPLRHGTLRNGRRPFTGIIRLGFRPSMANGAGG